MRDRAELLETVGRRSGVMDALSVQAFVEAHQVPPPVSIRMNVLKWPGAPIGEAVAWASDAYYLDRRPNFTFDPLFHAGAYYVQEAGSMFVEQAVRAAGLSGTDCVALDLCAAPGGKSTHLLSVLGPGALLVSNEVVRPRARVLCDNMTKWGRANAIVTSSEPALFSGLPEFFDLVVVDAPCSGEGLFRKDSEAMDHWSEEAVMHCAARQQDILDHAWRTLRPGGHLIYSTCTYNRTENEEQVNRLLEQGGTSVRIPIPEGQGILEVEAGGVWAYRFMPHLTRAEGFFLALIRKPGDDAAFRPTAPKGFWKEMPDRDLPEFLAAEGDTCRTVRKDDTCIAVTAAVMALFPSISKHVYPLQFGVEVAKRTKDLWVPGHAWAVSVLPHTDALEHIELDLEQAVHYLRGNPLPAQGARGYATVRYRGLVLGTVKGAGNRWNNLYPDPLRIRDMRTSVSEVVTAPL